MAEQRFVPAVISDLQNLKKTIGGLDLEREFIRNNVNKLQIRQGPLKISSGDASGLLTWDVDQWDEEKWGPLTGTDLASVRIVNHQKTFLEPFLVTDYRNAGVTTATWTGNGSLVMTSGEVAQSAVFALDTTAFTQARIIVAATDTSVLTIQISYDGGNNFQTVTNGVLTTGTTTSVAGLAWKITSTGSSTISRVTVQYDA